MRNLYFFLFCPFPMIPTHYIYMYRVHYSIYHMILCEEIHRYSYSSNNVHLKLAYRKKKHQKITFLVTVCKSWFCNSMFYWDFNNLYYVYNCIFYWDFNNPFFIYSMCRFIPFTCDVSLFQFSFYFFEVQFERIHHQGKNHLQIDVEKLLVVEKTSNSSSHGLIKQMYHFSRHAS